MDELVKTWLEEYQEAIRSGKPEDALPLFAENAVVFGTNVNWSRYVPEYAKKQGEPVFGGSTDFEITQTLSTVQMDESAYVAILWKDKVVVQGQTKDRYGRATFGLQIQDETFVAIHSHVSEFPEAN
jgi:hypothetical protein